MASGQGPQSPVRHCMWLGRAEAEVLQAEKKVKKAKRALDRAQAAEQEAETVVDRRAKALESVDNDKLNMQLRLVERAETRWTEARIASKDAAIELLEAHLEDQLEIELMQAFSYHPS